MNLKDAIYDASYDVLFNCQILIQCTWDAHVKCWCIAGIFGEYNGLLMLGLCWRRFVKIAHSVYSWCIRMYAVWCMRMHDHIFLHTVNHTHTHWNRIYGKKVFDTLPLTSGPLVKWVCAMCSMTSAIIIMMIMMMMRMMRMMMIMVMMMVMMIISWSQLKQSQRGGDHTLALLPFLLQLLPYIDIGIVAIVAQCCVAIVLLPTWHLRTPWPSYNWSIFSRFSLWGVIAIATILL